MTLIKIIREFKEAIVGMNSKFWVFMLVLSFIMVACYGLGSGPDKW